LFAQKAVTTPEKESAGVMVLHKTVRRVVVDVTVRDSNGRPVYGLAANDFSVSEDGHPQRILAFEAHHLDSASVSLPPNTALPPNVFVNVPKVPERGPLYVILFDMVNMEMEDQITARKAVIQFIRSKPEGTRFAIYVHSDGSHLVQSFTEDKDLLYGAVNVDKPRPHFPRVFLLSRNFNAGNPVPMIGVLTHIGEFLDGIPGRKNLIWLSGSFPLALFPSEAYPVDLQQDIRKEVNALTRAQISVYPVNVRGLVVNPEGALTGARPNGGSTSVPQSVDTRGGTGSDTNSLSNPSAGGMALAGRLQSEGSSLNQNYAEEDAVASATGGRAFYSDNDVTAALDEALNDGGNYYTVVYSPTNPDYDGRLRKIAVELKKRGYLLSYRRSYYADDPTVTQGPSKKNQPVDDEQQAKLKQEERTIYASLQHGAPMVHQLIFKARIHPVGAPVVANPEQMAMFAEQPAFSRGHKNAKALKPFQIQTYDIYYALVASQIKLSKDQSLPLEFAVVAFDSEGNVVNAIIEKAADGNSSNPFSALQVAAPESWEPTNQKIYRAMQEVQVPITATSIRVAVRDTSTDRVGSLEISLPLPQEPQVHAMTAVPLPATTDRN